MKLIRILVVLGLFVAAMATNLPARATHTYVPPIDRSPLPKLAGDITVLGDESAWMRVRLPKSIDSEKIRWANDFHVQGRGRLFGILMVREVDGHIERRSDSLHFLKSGMCNSRGCKPKPMAMISGGSSSTLRAGIYRLYVLADGGPVSVRFTTPELPGVVRLNPTRTARAKVHNLTPRVHTGSNGVIYSAGDERPFRGPGFAFQAQWVDPMGAGVINRDLCWYTKEAPSDPKTAYLPPACPVSLWWELLTLTTTTYSPVTWSDDCCWEMHFSANFLPKAMGSYYTLTTPADHYGAAALWLKID